MPIPVLLQGQGLTAIIPAACGVPAAADEDSAATSFLGLVDYSAFHAAGDRDYLAGDMAGQDR